MKTVIKDKFMDDLIAQGLSQGRAQGLTEGKVIEAASLLLLFLESRFVVPLERREQVTGCTDVGQIENWFRQALSAVTLDQVFGV